MKRYLQIGACLWLFNVQLCVAQEARSQAEAGQLVTRIIEASGGTDRLLNRFRIQEQLNVSDDPEAAPGKPRESVFDGHDDWWFRSGKGAWKKKEKEPAVHLVWVWTLQALIDPKSNLELLPAPADGDPECVGIRISESIEPPLDAYFHQETLRLTRIDWRKDIHRFSDWKDADNAHYPARCVGYRKETGKAWYVSQIMELNRLSELPDELTR